MTTSISFHTYKMFRLSNFGTRTARDAFSRLKGEQEQNKPSLPYPTLSLGHNTCFLWKGFTILITVGYDEDADYFWIGEFSDTPKEDAIPHEQGNHRTYNYFNPTVTIAEYQEEYKQQGYARHESWLMAKKALKNDYKKMLHYNETGSPIIEVTASKQGIPLGNAEISTWDWDNVQETLINYNLIEEAIADAEMNLKQLYICV